MSVFKVTHTSVTYYPDGPVNPVTVEQGKMITLSDNLDYLVGTQINPDHVVKIDETVLAKAAAEAEKAQNKVIDQADKADAK